jgi:hypothetical protein
MNTFSNTRDVKSSRPIIVPGGNNHPPRPALAGVYGSSAALTFIPEGYDGYSALAPTFRSYAPIVVEQAERDMEQALAAFQRLTTYGFTDPEVMRRKFDLAAERFGCQRADMFAPDHLSAFVAAQACLRVNAANPADHSDAANDKAATNALRPGDQMSSCWLQQIVSDNIGFVAHGVIIAAAFVEGYALSQSRNERCGPFPFAWVDIALTGDVWLRELRRLKIL